MGGVFLWTGFDYYGEPSPFNWPAISSQFGIADLCGFPKDYYYYYQAHWTKEPMVHVMPSWNKSEITFDQNGKVLVKAFSNVKEIELFINGQSFGKKETQDCQASWTVDFEPGELKVVAYQNDKVVAETKRLTNKTTTKVVANEIFSGKEIDLFELKAIDENGNFVEGVNDQIRLEVDGGKLVNSANGNPINQIVGNSQTVKLFSGKALAIVQKNDVDTVKVEAKMN